MRIEKIFSWTAFLWLTGLVFTPLLLLLVLSFFQKGSYGGIEWVLTSKNYEEAFSFNYFRILLRSLNWAFLTGLICCMFSVVTSWILLTLPPQKRFFVLAFLCLPSLVNVMIRLYSLKVFVGVDGPWARILQWLHIPFDPLHLTANPSLVLVGLVLTYWPWSLLPTVTAFEKIPLALIEAAQDLGATHTRVFFEVLWPRLKVPLVQAFFLVFIPCVGEFVIPDVLGGATAMNWGNVLTDKFLKSRDWPLGAALSILLIGLVFLKMIIPSDDKNKKSRVSA